MKRKSNRNICLSLLALATILTVGVKDSLAYFTTYTTAEGGLPVHLRDRTEITETFDSRTKHIVITSDADSEPVYIRAKAFCARYGFTYQSNPEGTWTQETGSWNRVVPAEESGGYWYYKEIVNGGGATTTLDVVIDIPSQPEETDPDQTKLEDGDSFNVIVIYESTPVRYDENGEPYADWSETLDVVTAAGEPDSDNTLSEADAAAREGNGDSDWAGAVNRDDSAQAGAGVGAGGDANVGE